jgi:hypothetical protein
MIDTSDDYKRMRLSELLVSLYHGLDTIDEKLKVQETNDGSLREEIHMLKNTLAET